MTATPIPRTLSLTLYGDLDTTASRAAAGPPPVEDAGSCRERARGRLRVHPRAAARGPAVLRRVPAGRGIRGSSQARRRHGEARAARAGEFRGLPRRVMHGQMQRARSMRRWRASRPATLDVLVATSVIEVGIDVPNATVIVIEEADRFGLSQLHQLRGRVGRGEHESYCLLFSDRRASFARQRLEAVDDERDGFRLAEVDLTLARRGRPARHQAVGPAGVPRRAPARGRRAARARARSLDRAAARRPELAQPENALLRAALERRFGALEVEPIAALVRVVAGQFKGRRSRAPRGAGDAADRRPGARGALQHARPVEGPPCSTCSRARARSASRRCRAVPRAPRSSTRIRRARARAGRTSSAPGPAAAAEVVRADSLRFLRSAARPASAGTWSSATRPIDSPPLGQGPRAALRRSSRPRRGSCARAPRDNPLRLDLPLVTERRYGDTLIAVFAAGE